MTMQEHSKQSADPPKCWNWRIWNCSRSCNVHYGTLPALIIYVLVPTLCSWRGVRQGLGQQMHWDRSSASVWYFHKEAATHRTNAVSARHGKPGTVDFAQEGVTLTVTAVQVCPNICKVKKQFNLLPLMLVFNASTTTFYFQGPVISGLFLKVVYYQIHFSMSVIIRFISQCWSVAHPFNKVYNIYRKKFLLGDCATLTEAPQAYKWPTWLSFGSIQYLKIAQHTAVLQEELLTAFQWNSITTSVIPHQKTQGYREGYFHFWVPGRLN